MKLTVSQDNLAAGLSTTARAVSAKNTIPVLSGILVEANGSTIRLRSTDLELSMECEIDGTVSAPGSVVLPARYLTDLVRHIPFGDLELSVDNRTHIATIRWSTSEYNIHGFSPEQFPQKTDSREGVGVRLSQGLLRDLLRQTTFAVAHDDTRPYLTGVCFHLEGNRLMATATDSVRIAHGSVAVAEEERTPMRAIVPGRSLNELARLLSDEPSQAVDVLFADKHVEFQVGKTNVVSRLLEGQFPDVMRLVPQEYPIAATVARDLFQETVERAALLAKDGAIKISLRSDTMVITANTPEVGQVYEEIPCTLKGEPLEIGFNSRYLLEGTRPMDEGEFVFEFSGNRNPSRMRGNDSGNYRYVVLPLITY